tara:strand:- start:65 stop:352 length:288 start_codon:yes stop_codon:yes gene_type:complete
MAKAKKEEVVDLKPSKVSEEQLKKIQSVVDRINKAQMDIGALEARKHQALHFIAGVNDELTLLQQELKKEYGTDDINIMDGTVNYPENGQADKKN